MTHYVCCIIVCAIFLGSSLGQDSIPLSQDGDHVCTSTESFQDRRTVSMITAYEMTYQTSCGFFQTCYRLRTEYRAAYSFEFFVNYRNVTVCCDGYVQNDESCTSCSSDTWGAGCANQCQCENGATCDSIDGRCHCPHGYTGSLCDLPCPPGKYGQSCSLTCDCPSSCQPDDGTCICEPGYTGQGCNTTCPTGTFGQDCAGVCPICINGGSCDPVMGVCVCQGGFEGVHCNIALQSMCNCTNGGYCDENVVGCVCPDGFEGEWCELEAEGTKDDTFKNPQQLLHNPSRQNELLAGGMLTNHHLRRQHLHDLKKRETGDGANATALTILNCPEHITVVNYMNSSEVVVQWDEPSASSTNGPVTLITQTHEPGDNFTRNSQSTVTYVYEDSAGIAEKCEFVVKITEDNTPPVISNCPSDLSVTREIGVDDLMVTWIEPSATDDSGTLNVLQSHMPGDVFSQGTATVNYTFMDQAGNADSCIFTVNLIKVDTLPPMVTTCPSDIVVSIEIGQGPVPVSWEPPMVADLGGAVFQSHDYNPNDTFMVGKTEVVYKFIDLAQNSASCNFTVSVVEFDSLPPTILNCPDNLTEHVEVGTLTVAVTWTEPTASDNSGVNLTVTNNFFPGMSFPAGIAQVVYIFSDSSGNEARCSFFITVTPVDTTPPLVQNCPSTQLVSLEVGTSNTVVTWSEPTVSDNSGFFVLIGPSHSPGEAFPVGVTDVVYKYEDSSGNVAFCNFTVMVISEDTMQPIITGCPQTQMHTVEAGTNKTVVTWPEPTASDASGFVSLSSINIRPGGEFPVGVTEVEYVFVDASGNRAICSFTVEVISVDTIAPDVMNCPIIIMEEVEEGTPSVNITWTEPTASDLSGSPVKVTQSQPSPPVEFPTEVMVHIVMYTFEDAAGNLADCTFPIFLSTVDTVAPMISNCPDTISATTELGTLSKAVTWDEITAADASGSFTETHTHVSGEMFPIGVTEVTLNFTDMTGNSAVCTFNVSLIAVDTTPPLFENCPTGQVEQVEVGITNTIVTWEQVRAVDASPTNVISQNYFPGDRFPVGVTTVSIVVEDSSGLRSICNFTVEVVAVDTTSPVVLNCPEGDISETVGPGETSATVFWPEPHAFDLSGTERLLERSHSPGDEFGLGVTMVTYVFGDDSNNAAICQFSVNVLLVDTTPPEIMGCPENLVVEVETGTLEAEVSWDEPTASDPSGVGLASQSHQPPEVFPVGSETVVTYRFVDSFGIRNECTFIIRIKAVDTLSPVITGCPDDIREDLEAGVATIHVTWMEPTAADNGPMQPFLSIRTHAPGSSFPPGNTTVRYVFYDFSNNSASCVFVVVITVVDTLPPDVMNCPSNVHGPSIELGSNGTMVLWSEPSSVDRSGKPVSLIGPTHRPGDVFGAGGTQVIYRFVDAVGLESVCEFLVIVDEVDTTPPTVHGCPQSQMSTVELGVAGVPVEWEEPFAKDLSDNVTLVSQSYHPGHIFLVGRVTVRYIFRDSSGNEAECSFHVTVTTVDTKPPVVFGCPDDVVVTVPHLSTHANVTWVEPTAQDLSGMVSVFSMYPEPNGRFEVGVTSVTYTFTDRSNNRADCTFSITVQTDGPDQIVITSCPKDIEVKTNPSSEVSVFWVEPSATNDAETVSLFFSSHTPPVRLPVGVTMVQYIFQDDMGSFASCQFSVIVVEASVLVCPEVNITAVAPSDRDSVAVNWTSTMIGNNTGLVQITSIKSSGDQFPIGVTKVNYTLVNEQTGASKDCTFTVIVFDVTPPEIFNCPTDITIGLPSGANSLAVTWREPVAEDNSNRVSGTKSSKPGDKFSIGSQIVVYEFSDPSGNINSCSFLIRLTGDNAPFGNDLIVTLAASCGVILFAIFVVAACLASVCCCRSRASSHRMDDDDIDLDDNYFNDQYNQGALTDVHYTNNGYHKAEQQGNPQYDQPPSASNSIKKRDSINKSLQRRESHYSQTLPHRPIQDPLDQGTRTIKRAYSGPVPGTSTATARLKSYPQLEVELHQKAVSALGQEFAPIPEELDSGDYLEIKYPSEGI